MITQAGAIEAAADEEFTTTVARAPAPTAASAAPSAMVVARIATTRSTTQSECLDDVRVTAVEPKPVW